MKTKRLINYEFIRVLAMIFVISIHQLDMIKGNYSNSINNNIYYILSLIFLTCNGLFFILSGKFALSFDCEKKDYKKYYLSKVSKILIPVLIYMCIKEFYLFFNTYDEPITLYLYLKKLFLSVFEGFSNIEYWFIYFLLANLIIAPFLARIFNKLDKKEMRLFFIISLLSNAFVVYFKLINITFAIPFYLSGINIYFLLGGYIDKLFTTKKEKRILYILGIVSFIISFVQLFFNKAVNIYDVAPTYTLITCAIFVLLRDNIKIKNSIVSKIIIFLGKYSFSIYLIHMMIMDLVSYVFPFKNINVYLYLIIKIFLNLIVSLLCVFIIDNTIVLFIKKVFDKIKNFKRKVI